MVYYTLTLSIRSTRVSQIFFPPLLLAQALTSSLTHSSYRARTSVFIYLTSRRLPIADTRAVAFFKENCVEIGGVHLMVGSGGGTTQ
jgi:hypothetical protein